MDKYNILKFLSATQAVLTKDENYFVASFADVPFSGKEVLVFPSDQHGNISSYHEVDGARGYESLADFICENCNVGSNHENI